MTNKEQTIIDGIILNDVKNLLFTGQRSSITTSTFEKIIDLLEEKAQECEQKDKTIADLVGCVSLWEEFSNEESRLAKSSSIADLVVLLRQKTAECEELKEKYKWYDHYKDSALANKDLCNKKIDEIGRCRKALEEIKGIACNEMCDMLGHFCAGCDDKPSCKTLKILDIISKVKGEENAR